MEEHIIIEPVVNLRRQPVPGEVSYAHDDLQATQLLFNERVRVKDHEGDWVLVEAVEQEAFRPTGQWEGYPGWVEANALEPAPRPDISQARTVRSAFAPVFTDPDEESDFLFALSVGTRIPLGPTRWRDSTFYLINAGKGRQGWVDSRHFRGAASAADEESIRKEILAVAELFLGTTYLWGGRSIHMPHVTSVATGVDCSGLINLIFRVLGIDLPRDAHEQRMRTKPIPTDSLKPGDLIFITPFSGETNHVMLFTGGEHFMEAVESGTAVGVHTFEERFGATRGDLSSLGGKESAFTLSFGRAL